MSAFPTTTKTRNNLCIRITTHRPSSNGMLLIQFMHFKFKFHGDFIGWVLGVWRSYKITVLSVHHIITIAYNTAFVGLTTIHHTSKQWNVFCGSSEWDKNGRWAGPAKTWLMWTRCILHSRTISSMQCILDRAINCSWPVELQIYTLNEISAVLLHPIALESRAVLMINNAQHDRMSPLLSNSQRYLRSALGVSTWCMKRCYFNKSRRYFSMALRKWWCTRRARSTCSHPPRFYAEQSPYSFAFEDPCCCQMLRRCKRVRAVCLTDVEIRT